MEQYSLYNNTVTLVFDTDKHKYYVDDRVVPGVTGVLNRLGKPYLIWWAARMAKEHILENLMPGAALDEMQVLKLAEGAYYAHNNKKKTAGDKGTWVHDWIEDYVSGKTKTLPINEDLKKAVIDFKKWYDNSQIKTIEAERILYSKQYHLAGKTDWIGELDGKLTILDWKTGSGIYLEQFLQLGAYVLMYEEETGQKIEQIGIINCSVSKPFMVKITDKIKEYAQIYVDVLNLDNNLKVLEGEF